MRAKPISIKGTGSNTHCSSRRRLRQSFLKDRAEAKKFFQARWFAEIPTRAETVSVGPVLMGVWGAENDDRYLTAPLTATHGFQDLPSRLLREIQVDDREVGTIDQVGIKRLNELYCLLSIAQDSQFAFDSVLFERFAD
jgi:hypothetical protein